MCLEQKSGLLKFLGWGGGFAEGDREIETLGRRKKRLWLSVVKWYQPLPEETPVWVLYHANESSEPQRNTATSLTTLTASHPRTTYFSTSLL